ncbi:SusC/RagA family TonB-linked outer membrane protein [Hymenobacter weizhouensis]|uniref:SusC/RagA family TonB-linked outer membrane protein n=1 Tax=Hymenobacter sp. YIM 151500-1 TaxID=2987689 RepID=UPI0022278C96|nr:TonB-dependent receptor [Hymenobacter sp. YIM 151500-1]UYZ64611.1 TonB-dependent receptor [Hymenobacter sp. YIM 151500-1]
MKHPYLAKLAFPLLCAGVSVSSAYAQGAGTVSGRVLDEKNQGLPGVTVLIEGTNLGGSTNSDGTFSIQNVPSGSQTLVLSFVGYTTRRQPITVTGGQNTEVSTVTLSENTTLLNEAVVIGYGTQRKQDLTGAVEQISEKQFVKGQVTNPEQLVQGKVAGLQVTTGGGAPGTATAIRIRGGSSLNASNDPLIIIDGVPVDNRSLGGASNPLSLINPNDIESISVLKDASATAIYGSRASNGVIIVTTKRGVQGDKLRINVSSQNSISEPRNYVDVLNGSEFRALVQARGNANQRTLTGLASTDWQREILRTAQTTDNNVSLTGAVGKVPFRVSGGYLDQEGLLLRNDLKRYTGALSLTPVLLDGSLRVDANVKGSWIDNNFSNQDAVRDAVLFDPTQPIRSSNPALARYGGYFEFLNPVDANNPTAPRFVNPLAPRNPVSRIEQTRDRSTVKRSIGNIQLEYKLPFLSALSGVVNAGYDIQQGRGSRFRAATSGILAGGRLGQLEQYRNDNYNKLLETYAKYNADLGPGRLDLVGGYSYQDFRYRDYVFDDRLLDGSIFNNQPADRPINGREYFDPGYNLQSFFGRANFNIGDKYLFTASFRADGSSRFAENKRWGYFPAGAFAWRVKGEEFLQNSTAISELKVRLGYGITGQQDIGSNYYGYQALYIPSRNTAQYQLGTEYINTLRPSFYNPDLTWETTTTYNVGLDYGFFDGRVSGLVDFYQRDTKDLLAQVNVPALVNLSNAGFFNIGSLTNKGVEAVVNVDIVRGDKFNWTFNANGNYNENEITELNVGSNPNFQGYELGGIAGGVGNNIQINTVGFPANSFYVYQQVYGADGKPLDGVVVDRNGDGQINNLDRYRYKSARPDVILGFGSNVSYGKANLAFTMRSNLNQYVYNNVRSQSIFVQGPGGFVNNVTREVFDNNFTSGNPQVIQSDYFVENGSFLRMENVTLGYNFGDVFKGTNLNLSFAVQNLFVITDYKGLDPEVVTFQNSFGSVTQTFGIDNTIYPRPRTYTLGLNIGF